MYMEDIPKEAPKAIFTLVGHLLAQCEVCGTIVRTSSRAKHLKTIKHWQFKHVRRTIENSQLER